MGEVFRLTKKRRWLLSVVRLSIAGCAWMYCVGAPAPKHLTSGGGEVGDMRDLGDGRCLAEIEQRVAALTEADQARWGVMSVGEMVRHVERAFRVAVGEDSVERVPSPLPRALVKWVALRMPGKWPKNLPTVPELRQGTEQMRVGAFEPERAALLEVMRRFANGAELRAEHPMLGRMGTGDWMRWGYRHTDHHLRQFGR